MVKLIRDVSANICAASAEADSRLFQHMFRQHAAGIYRLAYTQLHSRPEAQEIVQECFLKYWEKRHLVSPDVVAIRGYLYTSAYHAILNQVRRRRHWVYQDYPAGLAEQEPQTTELAYQELKLFYTTALAQLPAQRQRIFCMSRQQGLSNACIAQELNLSVKGVEAQITKALKFLRRYFTVRGVVMN